MVCADKWLYRITGCLIAGAMFFVSQSVFAVPAVVDYVIDGDTFAAAVKINTDISITVRVRILDIDTPEIHGKCESETYLANRAKDALAKLLPVGTVVDLQNVKDDKYLGRIDAQVVLPNGKSVSDIMINDGFARRYGGGRRDGWCN